MLSLLDESLNFSSLLQLQANPLTFQSLSIKLEIIFQLPSFFLQLLDLFLEGDLSFAGYLYHVLFTAIQFIKLLLLFLKHLRNSGDFILLFLEDILVHSYSVL